MSTEREQSHQQDHGHEQPSVDRDDIGVGRTTRSSLLTAPASPITSGLISRKADRDGNGVEKGADAAVSSASSSSGFSLPNPLLRKFEQSLGADLSSVRLHTGIASSAATSAVGAKAYAMGQDVHFGANQYDPSSSSGQHLIAHEVAHTVQQRGGSAHRQNKLEVSSPHDAHEHEADRAADAMIAGAPARVGGFSGGVHRQQAPADAAAQAPVAKPFNYDTVLNFVGPEAINGAWTSAPAFAASANDQHTTDAKDLFQAIWKMLQGEWNHLLPAATKYMAAQADAEATGTADFGKQKGDINDAADNARGTTHTKVSDAFDDKGGVIKGNALSFDGAKVSKDVKEQVANAKTDVANTDLQLKQCENNISTANAQLRIQVSVLNQKASQKDKIQTQGDIDAQLRMAAAYGNCAKIVGQAIDGAGKATGSEKFDGAVMAGTTSIASMVNTLVWDNAIGEINGAVEGLKGQLTSIDKWNAARDVQQAIEAIGIAKNTIQSAISVYKQTTAVRAQKFRALGSLLEKAGAQSGLSAKDAEKVSLAVQTKPLIEAALASAKEMNSALAGVDLSNLRASEPAQLGCGLAQNSGEFVSRYAIIKGAKSQMPQVVAKWSARLTTSDKLVNDAH